MNMCVHFADKELFQIDKSSQIITQNLTECYKNLYVVLFSVQPIPELHSTEYAAETLSSNS